jgi:hypothetical protein
VQLCCAENWKFKRSTTEAGIPKWPSYLSKLSLLRQHQMIRAGRPKLISSQNKVFPETNSQPRAIALGWLFPWPQLRLWRSAAKIFAVKIPRTCPVQNFASFPYVAI